MRPNWSIAGMTILAAAIISALVAPAHAQGRGMGAAPGMGAGKQSEGQPSKPEDSTKKKADDKAYKSALERLPEKPYDAWKNVRGQ